MLLFPNAAKQASEIAQSRRQTRAVASPMLCWLHATAAMGGGVLQPRPRAPFDPSMYKPAAPTLPSGAQLPKLIVFDLDNTIWYVSWFRYPPAARLPAACRPPLACRPPATRRSPAAHLHTLRR